MAQDSSNKLVTVGNLATFKQRLDALYSTQQSVSRTLSRFTESFVGNANNPLNCSTLNLGGCTLSLAQVQAQGASSYYELRIACGDYITQIPIAENNTLATTNDTDYLSTLIAGKADKVTITGNSRSQSFLTTPSINTFYGIYIVSGNGTVSDDTESSGTVDHISGRGGLVGKIMYIEDHSSNHIDGYSNPGFYLVTSVPNGSVGIINGVSYICPVYETGLYYSIANESFYTKSSDGTTITAISISDTTIYDGDLSYGVATQAEIDRIFGIIDDEEEEENNG